MEGRGEGRGENASNQLMCYVHFVKSTVCLNNHPFQKAFALQQTMKYGNYSLQMIGLFIVVKVGMRESLLTINTTIWVIREETLSHNSIIVSFTYS